jgi:hypothetical protein
MHINYKKTYRPLGEICAALAASFEASRTPQKRIEKDTRIHQSQISRILNGEVRRVSKNVLRLCKYAKVNPYSTGEYTVTDDQMLMDAIETAVGGSPQRARALVGVVRAVARALDAQPKIHQLGE